MLRQSGGKKPTVLIIGGGIAGLTTALALQRADVSVKVFEQAETSREEGAGVALWSNATHVLAHLGLGDLLPQVPARPPPRLAVMPQEMGQLVGQREALLAGPVGAVEEDQPVAAAGRQASP